MNKSKSGTDLKNCTIFFSWQSDLPQEKTTRIIRKAIDSAIKIIGKKSPNLRLIREEATSNVSGSPDIPQLILKKILASDIFVCDVTTINNNQKTMRPSPNPNVLVELGFAIAVLGLERIIMLFNKKFGNFTNDLPFDLEKKRVTGFNFPKNNDKDIDLDGVMTFAINLIIKNNPLKAIDTYNQPEAKKRSRDIANLKVFLNYIHIPSMDEYFSGLPRSFSSRALDFYEDCRSVVNNSLFHIYDPKLKRLINKLIYHWNILFSFDIRYTYYGHSNNYLFVLPGDIFPSEEHEKDWKRVETERDKMFKVFHNFLNYIRKEYLEIDLDASSLKAFQEYIKSNKLLDKRINKTLKNIGTKRTKRAKKLK